MRGKYRICRGCFDLEPEELMIENNIGWFCKSCYQTTTIVNIIMSVFLLFVLGLLVVAIL